MSSTSADDQLKPSGTTAHRRPGLQQQINVLRALVLHDIKSRFFGNGLGQVMLMFWPIIHITVLMSMYYFSARVVPFGQSALLYCVTGVIPFIVFSYMSRWMVFAVVQNGPFKQYPIITVLDIMLARAYLEAQTAFIVTAVILVALILLGVDCWPNNLSQASFAFFASIWVALGMGLINGAIASVIGQWITVYSISIVFFYATSGILFVPSHLPEPIRTVAGYLPSLQLVEWVRAAYYMDYPTQVLDRGYVLMFGSVTIALGLVMERVARLFR